ncbi:hypothetical protein IGB42_00569 [Andreprevotia sp. IGB-42]|uniref:MalM family protein n=1 Tax=Andreprevotia sp. IGB-42 TaxID=2497473 RepID=UPI001357AD34|nr:MalM family protein [Andreprevotia sp. IGB-42]KAF0814515.1 hypothetical protein IGB42_00569 [Andreprevotia sp. IGB-42]
MKLIGLLSISFILALLGGCAATTASQRVSAAETALTRSVALGDLRLSQQTALPLKLERAVIDSTSPSYIFENGEKAFFKLYKLPQFVTAYSVTILAQREGSMADASLFMPVVLTLDEQFRTRRSFDEKSLRNRGSGLERTIFINPTNADERYLIIRGASLKGMVVQSLQSTQVQPIVTPYGMFFYSNGIEVKAEVRSSAVGFIEIEQKGLADH